MGRYANLKILLDEGTQKRKFESLVYPKIPYSNLDIYIQTNSSDRLDTLAFKYYNDVSLWYIIAIANGIFTGSVSVPGGIQLRIPTEIDEFLKNVSVLQDSM